MLDWQSPHICTCVSHLMNAVSSTSGLTEACQNCEDNTPILEVEIPALYPSPGTTSTRHLI